ncbi:CAZyme family GH5 [Paecilomyces variotii]|nr:CAZyme family GH5 [Paecilomyces variotii]KAJ9289425.1 CAZyme family GH5 [Paecilomyces variotii]
MHACTALFVVVFYAALAHAWLPSSRDLAAFNATARYAELGQQKAPKKSGTNNRIRGVNFGGWLISEPWMMSQEWNETLNCGNAKSEFDCMLQAKNTSEQNDRFEDHWKNWITPDSVKSVYDVGLNTIRIPIGYWSYKDIVLPSEHFPDGDRMLPYLDAVVQKAADLGIFVILDLHGAPGAQQDDPFTGQLTTVPGFYDAANYGRAALWLSWMTKRIHTNPAYKTVGILEVLNEPVSKNDGSAYPASGENTLTSVFYPQALSAIRTAEKLLGVSDADALHVQYMDELWGAGDPDSNLGKDKSIAYDDHNYVLSVLTGGNQTTYMWYSCQTDNRRTDKETPKVVQEWSLMVGNKIQDDPDFTISNNQNKGFYSDWFAAQQQLYEQTNGWIFWTWRSDLDYRWTYSGATAAGVIPANASGLDWSANVDVCKKWFPHTKRRSAAAATAPHGLLTILGLLFLHFVLT